MIETIEDWSRVRSPGRARRRRAKHKQNIVFVTVPKPDAHQVGGTLFENLAVAEQMREMVVKEYSRSAPARS